MKVVKSIFNDVLVLASEKHTDDRGYFFESFHEGKFEDIVGAKWEFQQDNVSRSIAGVIRGMHYQVIAPNAKLIRVGVGRIWDVVVDIRRSSPTFGKWAGYELTDESGEQLWVPPGFAHGFIALSDIADVLYRTTAYHDPKYQRSIRWDDPVIGIDWPISRPPIVSERDANASLFDAAEVFA